MTRNKQSNLAKESNGADLRRRRCSVEISQLYSLLYIRTRVTLKILEMVGDMAECTGTDQTACQNFTMYIYVRCSL